VPLVLVHGMPETRDIWRPLREILDRDSVAVALPGFGAPRPDGFTATKDAYADWLGDGLRRVDGPIDVVAHDLGALLTMRVASAFDVPLRSWVVDVADIFHPRFAWPERVRICRRRGSGKSCSRQLGRPTSTTTAPPPQRFDSHSLARQSVSGCCS
jgi:pimeloyl-ACP methyl ester carboxylesterase